ncbi:MAG: metal-sensitive transcriptional regulator [Burkholderiales bacterium]|nr:metal-sensitive transcriptional regulator [Burkholderiales bacterium]MBP9768907.1 metal-sensitive transcriptional regulator [Burkholderiales bacterium]MBX9867177.1 metal-sensitive transcriptional regulator [Burkholderiales bacterium]
MEETKKNPNHISEIGKINRAIGQLEGVKKMIEDGRYCVEILQQLKAARSATKSVELSILKRHMQMCLTKAVKNQDEAELLVKIDELQNLIKNFD